jgi:hypothetical protein
MDKKTKKTNKVTITFDERQLPILVRALEAFTRFRSGQITMALNEIYADKQTKALLGKDYNHIDDNKDIEKLIRKVYFKDLKYDNESFGVGGLGFGGDEAYTISKTLRQYLAYERNEGYAGFGVDFGGVIGKYGEYEKPEIKGFSTRKFFRAPKSIQKQLEDLIEVGNFGGAFDLIDKKFKTLPRGDKYELGYQLPYDPSEHYQNIGVWVTAPRKKE